MKKMYLSVSLFLLTCGAFAQTQYEAFNRDAELATAVKTFNFKPFIESKVVFTYDTLERKVNSQGATDLMKQFVILDKKTTIQKAAETNNGFTQTYGVYKNDEALWYIRFEFDMETMVLKEIFLEKN